MQSTRRDFLGKAFLFGAALCVSRGVIACATDATRGEAFGQSENGLVTCGPATIGTNHPPPREHTLVVPSADVSAGVEKTYSIKGNSGHDHTVTITAAQFAALGAGGTLEIVSTLAGTGATAHTHTVSVSCASDADAGTPTTDAAAPSRCGTGAGATSISSNHKHALFVPAEDVAAKVEKTYSIKGESSHDHKVTITSAQFAELASGASIVVEATVVGTPPMAHGHSVTVSCAFSAPDA